MSKLPAIPDFIDTPESIGTTLRAVKGAVEILGGQRQGQSLGAPAVYYQDQPPTVSRQTALYIGDLWINPEARKMSFWNGREWVQFI